MNDLERLKEAIATGDSFKDRLVHEFPRGVFDVLIKAARAYAALLANGERVEWCETHNAESIQSPLGMSDECWRVVWVNNGEPEGVDYPYDLCRIVSKLLIEEVP